MLQSWIGIKEALFSYQGYGLLFSFFACAMILIFIYEKSKINRTIFLCLPITLIILFLSPLFYRLSVQYFLDEDTEVYYRMLWLIPFTVIISAGAVLFLINIKSKPKRVIFVILTCAIITVFGDYTYSNPRMTRMENAYKVPQVVANLCDEIIVPGREVLAVFPSQLLTYVRQYTPFVCMPYGRQMLVTRWGFHDNLYDAMEADIIDSKALSVLAKDRDVAFVILSADKTYVDGDLSKYGFTVRSRLNGFYVYQNDDAYLGLWDE